MERWPQLRIADWSDTRDTLHLWTQIVGKIRMKQEPMINHWWNVTLYVTPRGLTTSMMPYGDAGSFRIDFDFLEHELLIEDCNRGRASFALEPMTVAAFYQRVMEALAALDIHVRINRRPNEVVDATAFDEDTKHASYDRDAAERFWRVLLQADRVCREFRSGFLGKASPVHFFWGSFDLAVTRFSGRTAPPHPGGFPNMPDSATREAYSHEEHSVGFWPGGNGAEALFYAYAYPEPVGFASAEVGPKGAAWSTTAKEFVYPYEVLRRAEDPDAALLQFFNSTYVAAATLAHWPRQLLER
jgi:hypothetical protein